MNSDLSHLPEHKQQQLRGITDVIVDEMARVKEELAFIILFGSYARGNWVEEEGIDEDGGHRYIYKSDFDILVVPVRACENHPWLWHNINKKLSRTIHPTDMRQTPVSLIAHHIGYVNDRLEENQYFFSDIKKEGIVLFDAGTHQLAENQELTNERRKQKAQEHFDHWFNKSKSLFIAFDASFQASELNDAAFLLHQITERLYAASSLVFRDYKHKTHDIERLERFVGSAEPELLKAFPKGTKEDEHLFDLLKRAYVDARYKKSYAITHEELAILAERVRHLQSLTEQLCRKQIECYDIKS